MIYATGHLEAFAPSVQAEAVAWVMRTLRSAPFDTQTPDAIAFRGQSGAAVSYPVAALTGIPLAHVRKPECTSHLGNRWRIVGNVRPARYVIVDDFIETGATVNEVYTQLCAAAAASRCVGILLYRWSYDTRVGEHTFSAVGRHCAKTVPVWQRVRDERGNRTTAPCVLGAEISAWAAITDLQSKGYR